MFPFFLRSLFTALTGKRIQVSIASVFPIAATVSQLSCIPNGSIKSTARCFFQFRSLHSCWRY